MENKFKHSTSSTTFVTIKKVLLFENIFLARLFFFSSVLLLLPEIFLFVFTQLLIPFFSSADIFLYNDFFPSRFLQPLQLCVSAFSSILLIISFGFSFFHIWNGSVYHIINIFIFILMTTFYNFRWRTLFSAHRTIPARKELSLSDRAIYFHRFPNDLSERCR